MAYKRSKSDELLQYGNNNVPNKRKMIFSPKNAKENKWSHLLTSHFHLDFSFVSTLSVLCYIIFLLSQSASWTLFSMFLFLFFIEPQMFSILKQANQSRKKQFESIWFDCFFCLTICGLDCNADKATTIRYHARSFCFRSWCFFFVIDSKFCHEAPWSAQRQSAVKCKLCASIFDSTSVCIDY